MLKVPVLMRHFTCEQRIIAALELAADGGFDGAEVSVSHAVMASLAFDLLHRPLAELEATRARLAATYPLPEGVTP